MNEVPTPAPRVIELFAGAGGMAVGFRRAGFDTVLATDWNATACETLRAAGFSPVVCAPIEAIDVFPAADVIAGGPPCQGFSNLGTNDPGDPRNTLWRHYMRAVAQVRPAVFVLENVPPFLRSAEFARLTADARALGYSVEGRVLNAADYGVPQTRKRALVVGRRGAAPVFPEPTHADPAKRRGLPAWRTVRDALAGVPFEPDGRDGHTGRNPTATSLARYRAVPPGGNRFDLPLELTPACWRKKPRGSTDLFGRLWWDRPSVTIRTEFYKPEKGRYLHPEAHRPITHLEAALLQGFDRRWPFAGSRIERGVQIGNAVPPPLAHAVATAVRAMLVAPALPGARVA